MVELPVPWWQGSYIGTLTLAGSHLCPYLGNCACACACACSHSQVFKEEASWLRSEVRFFGSHLAAPSLSLSFLTYSVRR